MFKNIFKNINKSIVIETRRKFSEKLLNALNFQFVRYNGILFILEINIKSLKNMSLTEGIDILVVKERE